MKNRQGETNSEDMEQTLYEEQKGLDKQSGYGTNCV